MADMKPLIIPIAFESTQLIADEKAFETAEPIAPPIDLNIFLIVFHTPVKNDPTDEKAFLMPF